jgi:hypothetical protein
MALWDKLKKEQYLEVVILIQEGNEFSQEKPRNGKKKPHLQS